MREEPPDSAPTLDPKAASRLREQQMLTTPAIRHLIALDERGELTTAHVRLVAHTLGLHIRTVWRRLADAKRTGTTECPGRARFEITEDIRVKLAYHRGIVKNLHEELLAEAEQTHTHAPSLTTLHRAIRRDLPQETLQACVWAFPLPGPTTRTCGARPPAGTRNGRAITSRSPSSSWPATACSSPG